ncbi:hypothetical protein GNI_136180 [Gregarina niphandrodes]|uniref:Uncharacterized protein n=1 Tax=Gregarina niphandrodes TaxID=110365 RepID=A0A023B0V8_GRENI|nr:hypothetical protein GNI_136180 [Gregarina niphandrodes]EZG45945.1 hypothetical protein GNI_136180 [Gregarina niphandrodes]|eukprot:XP_011132413.1 hypothetical protein GNI_136180 [Gregarina niphandrodes]
MNQGCDEPRNDYTTVEQLLKRPGAIKDALLVKEGLEFRRELFETECEKIRDAGRLLEQQMDKALAQATFHDAHIDLKRPSPTAQPFVQLVKHQDATIQ